MIPSNNCMALIEEFEGLRLSPYLDGGGKPTIGLGSTRYEDGSEVTMSDQAITKERAYSLMQFTLIFTAAQVCRLLHVNLTQNQFDAVCDFAYNCGIGNFFGSTLLKAINNGDMRGAALEFLKWNHVNGVVSEGLTRRRNAEMELFQS